MSSFDPMAAAIDWLDAYRAASFSIVDMYSINGALECGCDGSKTIYGRVAMTEYWRHRFDERPAGELIDLRPDGDDIIVSYAVPGEIVQVILQFDNDGKVRRSQCGPTTGKTIPFRK
jgi:hypothetical protein